MRKNKEVVAKVAMSTRLPRLAADHPAAVESHAMRHSISPSIGVARPKHTLLRTGAKCFSLMSHWLYSMIGFSRVAQIQEGNENVV